MEEAAQFRIIPIDGALVDIRRTFIELGSSLIRRPLMVPEDLLPPHTLARLSEAADLDETESRSIRRLIGIIEDFWTTLPAIEGATVPVYSRFYPDRSPPPIFYAKRVRARGRSVLLQTISWLEKYGFRNPICWIEEE